VQAYVQLININVRIKRKLLIIYGGLDTANIFFWKFWCLSGCIINNENVQQIPDPDFSSNIIGKSESDYSKH